jgi:PAS domain S-box-containing protein
LDQQPVAPLQAWPPGDSQMARLVRAHDWAATPLGAIETWPMELRSSAAFVLENRFPAALVWGPGLVTIYNDAFRPILGEKPEALGRSFADIWREAWDEIAPMVEGAFDGRSTFIEDFPLLIDRSGRPEQAYFTFSYSPVRTGDGLVAGMIDTVVETTAHVQRAAAIKRSEEQFRAFVTASSDVVYRMSPDWSEMRRLDGQGAVSDAQPANAAWMADYIPAEDVPEVRAAIARAIETGTMFELEHRVRNSDGTLAWTISRAVPIKDADGNVVEWLGAASDVSERRHAEDRARLLAAVVQSSDDAIITKDLDGVITSWNAGAERLFGYAAEEIVGRPVTVLMPPGREVEEPLILERIRRGEPIEHHETMRMRKDGTAFDVSLTISPVRDHAGTIVGASKIARDITERKRAEKLVEMLAMEAEHRTKNVFATVMATVRLTEADTVEDLRSLLEGRVRALSDVHGLFVKSRWSGADVGAIVRQELLPYRQQRGGRVVLEGPPLMAETASAQALAIIIHELVTNASKYGALSDAAGRVHVEWAEIEGDRLELRWVEAGGPSVTPPTKSGFGTSIMEQMTAARDGTIEFAWDRGGLACTVVLPK